MTPRSTTAGYSFREVTYSAQRVSDHCVIEARIGG